jgi:alkyl sulfatase BDS1-like metallo-beta-lactamase superfamily hydrolase
MTGWWLPKDDSDWHVSSGLGPYLGFFGPVQLIPPTETFTDPANVTIGGLEIQLYHTPGETIEELFAYIDDPAYNKIGFIGDNYYAMFPQLYTIRGTTPRPADDWANSLRFVLDNFPDMQIVAAGHTKVLQGRTQIEEALGDWILAIEDLSATTIAEINTGKSIYDIAAEYQLPVEIRNSPYLGQFYGQIADHVRAIHTQFNGWFTGDITELATESIYQKASFLLDLCNNCLKEVEDFLEDGHHNGALKLSDAIRVVKAEEDIDYCTDDDFLEATEIYIRAAKLMAYEQPASNNRNFFLTVALQISQNNCLLIKG